MFTKHLIQSADANLFEYPARDPERPASYANEITIGDLHGNTLKLLYILIRQNVIELSEEDYYIFLAIYYKETHALEKSDIIIFHAIVERIEAKPVGLVRLMGDDLCDRGSNDYFTLKVYQKLAESVKLEIILSNHSIAALIHHEQKYDPSEQLLSGITHSWENLLLLCQRNLVPLDEVAYLIENYYKPNLKALSYTLDVQNHTPVLTLYTHAPVGLETIGSLAKLYNIYYDETTVERLCLTINAINIEFCDAVQSGLLQRQYRYVTEQNIFPLEKEFALFRLVWNRYIMHPGTIRVDPSGIESYILRFVHGHEIIGGMYGQSYHPNMLSLDNNFGKSDCRDAFYHLLFMMRYPMLEKFYQFCRESKQEVASHNTWLAVRCGFFINQIKNVAKQLNGEMLIARDPDNTLINVLSDIVLAFTLLAVNEDFQKFEESCIELKKKLEFLKSSLRNIAVFIETEIIARINLLLKEAENVATINVYYLSAYPDQTTLLKQEYFKLAQYAKQFLDNKIYNGQALTSRDIHLIAKVLVHAEIYANSPTSQHRKKCLKLAKQVEGKAKWRQIICGTLFALLFAGFVVCAVLTAVATFGVASPLSAIGLMVSTSLAAKSLSISTGVAGLGLFALSTKMALDGRSQGFSKQVIRLASY